jgi:hypothetical protein
MRIDYRLLFDCPVRKALSDDGILDFLRDRATAAAAVAMFGKDPDPNTPAEKRTLTVERLVRDRTVKVETTAEKLLERAAALDPHAAHCEGCSANLAQRAFGCFGEIPTPIPGEAEEWLIKLCSDPQTTLTGSLLAQAIFDGGFTGAVSEEARADGKLFARSEGPVASWGSGGNAREIEADRLFELLLGVRRRKPDDAFLLLVMLNLVRLDGERIAEADDIRHAVSMLGSEPKEAAARLEIDVPLAAGRPPPAAAPWLEYFTALFAAALLRAEFAVSVD